MKLVSTDDSLSDQLKQKEFFKLHHVSREFHIISLRSWANLFKNSPNFLIYNLSTIFANISLMKYVWRERQNFGTLYFRDHLILPVILFAKYCLNKKVVYESHYILNKRFGQWLTERCVSVSDGIVVIAITLKNYYDKFNKNIIVAFCASSEKEKFLISGDKVYFRKQLGLALNKFYLVYTGNIDFTGNGDSYRVEDIVEALSLMPEEVMFIAVGKKTADVHSLEKQATHLGVGKKIICVPWVGRDKVVQYILASDILIIPESGAKPGNSPTKMFEYLSAKRPIIAADTEPIREVLHNGDNSILVEYQKPEAWSDAVRRLRDNPGLAHSLSVQAYMDADLYTWQKRAENIGQFIKKINA